MDYTICKLAERIPATWLNIPVYLSAFVQKLQSTEHLEGNSGQNSLILAPTYSDDILEGSAIHEFDAHGDGAVPRIVDCFEQPNDVRATPVTFTS